VFVKIEFPKVFNRKKDLKARIPQLASKELRYIRQNRRIPKLHPLKKFTIKIHRTDLKRKRTGTFLVYGARGSKYA
jgi:hypothetical protein